MTVVGSAKRLTATGTVTALDCQLLGFYVSSTTSGTLVLRIDGASGTQVSGTITPAIGWNEFPLSAPKGTNGGLHATIGGTALDVTFFVREGNS